MKVRSHYNPFEGVDVVTLEISHMDKSYALDSREIIQEVRFLIAKEIVSRIMDKLGPVLDVALGEVKQAASTADKLRGRHDDA